MKTMADYLVRVEKVCRECFTNTGKLPRTVILPVPAYRVWVRAFGPTMKIPCVWAGKANEVPLCVMRVREAPDFHLGAVSVVHPDDDPS